MFRSLLIASFLVLTPVPTALADYSSASQNFYKLGEEDRVLTALWLIATGDFNGVFRGEYTRRLHAAVESFQTREGFAPTGVLLPDQQERLKKRAETFLAPLGLQRFELSSGGPSLYVPRALFDTETRTSSGYAFERNDSSLSLLFEAISDQTFEKLYQRFTESRGTRFVSYRVLQPSYFISAGRFRGRNFYTWFSRTDAWPVGFTLSWTESRHEISGRLTTLLANAFEPQQTPSAAPHQPETPSASNEDKPEVANTSGTGFLVSDRGHIITNYHVADNCRQISARLGTRQAVSAEIVTSNPSKDLALLKANGGFGSAYAKFRAGAPVRAGEDIVVFGYPLAGALSTQGNLVPGSVTALAGLKNDTNSLQISAPVQPGNSGGPLLDRAGNVVGIVQSKLNALKTAELTGDIPQNVNFAIKGQVAVDFLDWVGFRYETAESSQTLSVSDVGDKAAQFTLLIECIRN